MIHEALLCKLGDHDGRNSCTRTPSINHWRWNVVPPAAILIIGNDDDRMFPDFLVRLNGRHDLRNMVLTANFVRITRMFIVGTERLDEGDRRQRSVSDV